MNFCSVGSCSSPHHFARTRQFDNARRYSPQLVYRTATTGVSTVGSTCCLGENGARTCCPHGEACCASAGSGSLDVPGFRPVCCHITSTATRAQCCSAAAQRSGTIPECCKSARVKPVCCTTSDNRFLCCKATASVPSCCFPNELPTSRPMLRAQHTPTVMETSCCNSVAPHFHCCQRLQSKALQTYSSNQEHCCTATCCYLIGFTTSCCRASRKSCCRLDLMHHRLQCCNQPGLTPFCCPGQPNRRTHWGHTQHIQSQEPFRTRSSNFDRSSAHQNFRQPSEEPPSWPTTTKMTLQNQGSVAQTRHPQTSPLSCCRAVEIVSCCSSGLRRSGGFPLCCPASPPLLSNSATSPPKTNSQQLSHSWATQRDELENLLRSEELQATASDYENQGNEYTPRVNPYLGRRQAHCSGIPYDTSEFICCREVLQVKLGAQPACCGTRSFDQSTQFCCNGKVESTCPVVK